MGDPFRDHALPRGPLLGVTLLVGGVVLAVALVRVTGFGLDRAPDAPAVSERAFRFEDRADGGIAVIDARSNQQVEAIAPGTNGFLRGTLRGLVRERKRQGVGPEEPFRLVADADGRLTLVDPATGRRVDLGAFGPTNGAAFAQLLVAGQAQR